MSAGTLRPSILTKPEIFIEVKSSVGKTISAVNLTYDGDGKRVKKSNGKLYWTGVGSDPLTETDLNGTATGDYIFFNFFNGKRPARLDLPGLVPHYYLSDLLGSTSVVAGVVSNAAVVQDESDYCPYGGERRITDSDPNSYKFTGKEGDQESDLDTFGVRYDSSNLGRFMTPDPRTISVARMLDPQQWNMYSYTRNNPLAFVDPDGNESVPSAVLLPVKNLEENINRRIYEMGKAYRQGKPLSGSPLPALRAMDHPTTAWGVGDVIGRELDKAASEQVLAEITSQWDAWINNPTTTSADLDAALLSLEGVTASNDVPEPLTWLMPEALVKSLYTLGHTGRQAELIRDLERKIRQAAVKKKQEEEEKRKKCAKEGEECPDTPPQPDARSAQGPW